MAKTSTVSVRDLKENVGELLTRASRGERIVITRYGTPRAVLCPVEIAPTDAPSRESAVSTDHAFEREARAFDRLLRQGTLAAHRGRYVAVSRARVIDSDPDAATLVRRTGLRLGQRVFFVGFVGSEEPLVDLPGQELR